MKFQILLIIAFTTIFSNCSSNNTEEKKSSEICDCAGSMIKKSSDLTEKFNTMQNVGEDEMKRLTAELQTYTDSVNVCVDKFKNDLNDSTVIKNLRKNCPPVAESILE